MASSSEYIPRVIDGELDRALRGQTAVLIEGAKGVGKTMTASHRAKSRVLLDVDQAARTAAAIDPSLVLAGERPRLIEEWQEVPAIWNHVRRAVDAREGPFILTGSAVAADDATRHTGAGQFVWLRMRPVTSFELGRPTGAASLQRLLDGRLPSTQADELWGSPGRPDTGFYAAV